MDKYSLREAKKLFDIPKFFTKEDADRIYSTLSEDAKKEVHDLFTKIVDKKETTKGSKAHLLTGIIFEKYVKPELSLLLSRLALPKSGSGPVQTPMGGEIDMSFIPIPQPKKGGNIIESHMGGNLVQGLLGGAKPRKPRVKKDSLMDVISVKSKK